MSQLFLPFDSETGGLDENTADILTLYMAIMDEDYKILEELDLKLKPDGRLPIAESQALAVNKINLQEHLANPETITYSQARIKIVEMIRRHLKKRGRFSNIRPFGYNVPFDERWVQKHILPKEEWLNLLHYKSVDVMNSVDDLKRWGWFPKELGSLITVVEYLQIPKRSAHSAKDDTLMTIDVDKKIISIMKDKKENSGSGNQDLITLLEAE